MIKMHVNELTAQQRVGQRIILGILGDKVDDAFRQMVQQYKIGNVILFKRNIINKEQLRQLCGEIQELVLDATGLPAFITIDQEGGAVTRLSEDCSNFPGAMAVAATGDPRNAYQAGLVTGQELLAMGVNFDLAPALDVNNNPQNPVIGVRSYGDTPQKVERYGLEMMRGLMDAGIMCCIKHFPGHGDTAVDSHLGLPQIDKSLAELEQVELAPFAAAIKAGAPGVMTTHILFPQIEPDKLPATMSRHIMTDLLRHRMGFTGLVVSDCMEMAAIQQFYGTPQGIASACRAGVDMVFCCHTYSFAIESMRLIAEDLQSGALPQQEHLDSVQRIIKAKAEYIRPASQSLDFVGCKQNSKQVDDMLRQGITVLSEGPPQLGNAPFVTGCPPYRATDASNKALLEFTFAEYMAEKLGGYCAVSSVNPNAGEIEALVEKAKAASSIIVGSYQAHLQPGQVALVQAMAALNLPVVCVALRNPYDMKTLPPSVYKICAYEYTRKACDAVVDVLQGRLKAGGVLPVEL